MSFFDYFRKRPKSASLAKDRLSIIVARERAGTRTGGAGLPAPAATGAAGCHRALRDDRHLSNVTVNLDRHGGSEVLELNIMLPERAACPVQFAAPVVRADPMRSGFRPVPAPQKFSSVYALLYT